MRHHWGIDALHLNLRRGNFSILLTTFGSATLIHSLSSIGKLTLKSRLVMIDLASSQLCNGALPLPPPECPLHQTRNFVRRLGQFAVVVKGRHDKRLKAPSSTETGLWGYWTKTYLLPRQKKSARSKLHPSEKSYLLQPLRTFPGSWPTSTTAALIHRHFSFPDHPTVKR